MRKSLSGSFRSAAAPFSLFTFEDLCSESSFSTVEKVQACVCVCVRVRALGEGASQLK